MRTDASLDIRISAGLIITLLIVVFMGVMSYRSINALIVSTDIVSRSHQVMTAIEATLGDVLTAESEARGYVITGDDTYLRLYEAAFNEVDADLAMLRNSVMDAHIRSRVDDLESIVRSRMERLKGTVLTRKARGFDAVRDSIAIGTGKNLMDELRRHIADIDAMETALLKNRNDHMHAVADRTITATIAGIVFVIALVGASMAITAREIKQRNRLEREILAISEREQKRIGQDLHDGICQQLTGTALLSRSLQMKLAARSAAEADEATRITALLNGAIEQTRSVTRGLHPVVDEPAGLMQALQELSSTVNGLGTLTCRFECPVPVPIPDPSAATHLYRIAQEAVQNAIRHARPSSLVISLKSDERAVSLVVSDDGCGLPVQRQKKGMGLAIMNYRAQTIGATLTVKPGDLRGTVVACTLPTSESA